MPATAWRARASSRWRRIGSVRDLRLPPKRRAGSRRPSTLPAQRTRWSPPSTCCSAATPARVRASARSASAGEGRWSLELAARSHRLGAAALCWGAHPRLDPDLAKVEAACLALFAQRDPLAPPAAARALEERLRAAGRRGAVRVVPDVSAGFLDAGRPAAFDAAAAAAAWDVLLSFLRAELA